MSRRHWKQRERDVARKVGGRRYPANTGGRVDVESAHHLIQIKERKTCSMREAEAIAVEMERLATQKSPPKSGTFWFKRSAGRGVETPWLVIMTEATWKAMNGRGLQELATERTDPCPSPRP